jgi:simple sugar transport system ATP-binding protein
VLLISQDLDELLALCSHLAVLHAGTLSPLRPVDALSVAEIGLLMGGVAADQRMKATQAHAA